MSQKEDGKLELQKMYLTKQKLKEINRRDRSFLERVKEALRILIYR